MHASWQIPLTAQLHPSQGPQMADRHPLPRQQTSVQTDKEQVTRVSLLSIASHSSHRRFGSPRLPSCPPAHLHPATRPRARRTRGEQVSCERPDPGHPCRQELKRESGSLPRRARNTHAQYGFSRPQVGLLPAHAQRAIFDAEGGEEEGSWMATWQERPAFHPRTAAAGSTRHLPHALSSRAPR